MFNLNSPQQVSDFLFNHLKLQPIKETAGGKSGEKKASVDESVILHYAEKEKIKFCSLLLEYRKLEKAKNNYLAELKRWIQEGIRYKIRTTFIHPDLWLNTTETVRSSSSNPNQQNQPKHGEIKKGLSWKILRKPIIPLGPDWLLAEVDYEGAEVKTAANLSGDKQLIKDLNEDLDMHSHWTNVIFGWNYELPEIKKLHDDERYIVKNNWTFANIYGASNISIAREFRKFDAYKKFVKEKYRQQTSYHERSSWNNFYIEYSEKHFAEAQKEFFNRYSGLKEWQEYLLQFYYGNGYIETPLGFRRNYPLSPNEIFNFPIQACSFHILLDAIIRIEEKLLQSNLKSYMCTQIHDSIFFMLYKKESLELMELVDYEMVNHNLTIPKRVELATEWSVGKNWMNMKSLPMCKEN